LTFHLDQPPDTVTFEAFAEWYTSIGHEFAPWLELLVSVDVADVLVEPFFF